MINNIFQRKKWFLVATIIITIAIIGIFFRDDIANNINKIQYTDEIEYAKQCIELLAEGDEKKISKVFVYNARFLNYPEYRRETSNYLNGLKKESFTLMRISTENEEGNNFLFLDFEVVDNEKLKQIHLKLKKISNEWLLYSIMLG
jgi:hypothetical protein